MRIRYEWPRHTTTVPFGHSQPACRRYGVVVAGMFLHVHVICSLGIYYFHRTESIYKYNMIGVFDWSAMKGTGALTKIETCCEGSEHLAISVNLDAPDVSGRGSGLSALNEGERKKERMKWLYDPATWVQTGWGPRVFSTLLNKDSWPRACLWSIPIDFLSENDWPPRAFVHSFIPGWPTGSIYTPVFPSSTL